jgi:hypothetical protein
LRMKFIFITKLLNGLPFCECFYNHLLLKLLPEFPFLIFHISYFGSTKNQT